MGDDRHAALHLLDRELDQRPPLGFGQADGLARVHGQRERIRAVAQMELDQLAVDVEVDTVVATERRDRRVHQAWLEISQSV